MSERAKERTYSDAEVEEQLKRSCRSGSYENGWIRRKFRRRSWKGTLMVDQHRRPSREPPGIIPTSPRPTRGSK